MHSEDGRESDYNSFLSAGKAGRIISDVGWWNYDNHDLSSRLSDTLILDASAAMADARGVKLETFLHRYVMPVEFKSGSDIGIAK